jgi:hypothetical protein
VRATSKEAMVYYGHGQTAPWYNALTHEAETNHGYRKQWLDDAGAPTSDPKFAAASRNAFQATRLGVLPTGTPASDNPNFYAGDWTLLRQQTILAKPGVADESPVPSTNIYGNNSGTRAGNDVLKDQDTQIAFQPAASSIFRSLSSWYPQGATTLRSAADGTYYKPVLASGTLDIAATCLSDIRAIVTSGYDPLTLVNYPDQINNNTVLPLVARRTFTPIGEGQNNQPQYLYHRPPVASYNDLDRMQAWMQDAFPTDSRNEPARATAVDFPVDRADTTPTQAIGTRMRYEPLATDVLAGMQPPAGATPPLSSQDQLRMAEYRADQLMLGRSILVPHCSEFIIEWSFGNLDPNGEVIWHGPNRQLDANNNGTIEPTEPFLARPFPWDKNNQERGYGTYVGFYTDVNPPHAQMPAFHPATDRLIYGFAPKGDEACLTSYFGWTDPTYIRSDLTGFITNTSATAPWPWPKLIRVTVTLSDAQDPTIESTFQYVFTTPSDKN